MDIPMSSQGEVSLALTGVESSSSPTGSITCRFELCPSSSSACLHDVDRRLFKNQQREMDYDSDDICEYSPQIPDDLSHCHGHGFLTPISKGRAANDNMLTTRLSCPGAPLKQAGCREVVEISRRVRRRLEFY